MVLLASLLILPVFWHQVTTAPATAPSSFVSWHDEPNTRGTWSIISSCVTTLVLCVYTAVHMNVPHAAASTRSRRLRLLRWILFGIFAPELVVWAAWCQWSEAKSLTDNILQMQIRLEGQKSSVPLESPSDPNQQALLNLLRSWTPQHSFFVAMGGYQVRPQIIDKEFWPESVPHTILSVRGFLHLLHNGHAASIPILSEKDLADRSKADSLAKTLSSIQGAWLALQLLSRVIGKLSITELEVNTFAHVLCALGMYIFWVKKPLNVQQPVFIDAQGLEHMLWTENVRTYLTRYVDKYGSRTILDYMDGQTLKIHVHHEIDPESCEQCERNNSVRQSNYLHGLIVSDTVRMTPGEVASLLTKHVPGRSDCVLDFDLDFVISKDQFVEKRGYDFGGVRVRMERIAQYQLDKLSKILDRFASDVDLKDYWLADRSSKSPVWRDAWCASADMIDSRFWDLTMKTFSMMGMCCMYGGLHASLWNHHFPTTAELWLWRISSLVVSGNGLIILLLSGALHVINLASDAKGPPFVNRCYERLSRAFDRLGMRTWSSNVIIVRRILKIFITIAAYIAFLMQFAFLFSRIFLFLEAFISLRSQPDSAYLTPQWSQWIPHL